MPEFIVRPHLDVLLSLYGPLSQGIARDSHALSRNAIALREASDAARERGAILKKMAVQQVTQQVRTSSKPPQPRSAEELVIYRSDSEGD